MIQINENQAFAIRTTTVAALNYSVTYDFYDPKTGQTDTRIDTYDGAITTVGLASFLNENSKIQRINYISIRNADGALTNKVTICKVVASIEYVITAAVQLLTGEFMEYTADEGWKVYDANGIQKYVGAAGPAGPAGTISAGTTAATLGQLNFIDSNGISFGISSDSITASASLTAVANINLSAGTTSNNLSAFTLSNLHGISFGLNGSVVTASHNGITSQSVQTQGRVSINGSTSNIVFSNQNGFTFGANNSTITGSFSTLSFANSHNVTFGILGQTLTASVSIAEPSNFTISAGAESISSGELVFSNSNNVSFGMDASTITASFSQSNQPRIQTISAGTTLISTGEVIFSNSHGIAFGVSGNTITASYSVPSTTGLISAINLSAGSTSENGTAFTFSDSGNVSFGLNAGTITASYNQSIQTQNMVSVLGSTGDISFADSNGITFGGNASTITASHNGLTSQSGQAFSAQGGSTAFQTLSFANGNGATFSNSNGSVQLSYTVPSVAGFISAINLSAGSTSNNLTKFQFNDSNGISFGLNGSSITASHNGLTSQSNQAVSAGNGSFAFQTLTFADSNGLSFSTGTQGLFVSYTVPSTTGLISAINLSAGTASNNLSKVTFSDSNNVSFGLNGSIITASASFVAQTNQTLGLYALGNTTQNSSTTLDARTLSFNAIGSLTIGYSNGSIQISAPNALTVQSNQNLSLFALGNTTQNSSTVLNASVLSLNGLGAATLGYSNGSLQVSVPVQTVQTQSNIQAVYDGANSISTGTIRFTNANGVSFSINGQTVSASVAAQSNQNISLFALGNTTQASSTVLNASNLSFNGLGAATLGYSNGSIQVSVPVQTVQTQSLIQALYDGANSISTGTVRVSNSNGISFGINGQTLTASHNGITSQSNQNLSLYALGNTTQNSSTVLNASALSFNGLGNITIGYSNGSVQISGAGSGGGGGVAIANSQTTFIASTVNLSAAGALTIASTTGQSLQFSVPSTSVITGAGQITISTAGNTISVSGGNIFYSTVFGKQNQFGYSTTSLGQNSIYFSPEIVGDFIVASAVKMPVNITLSSSATNAAWTRGHTVSFAVYTRQADTNSSALTRIYSTSYTAAAIMSSNANMSISIITAIGNSTSYNTVAANSAGINLTASVHGQREFIMPWATTLAPGEYWFAHAQSSSSGGGVGNMLNISHIIQSSLSGNRLGISTNVTADGIMKNIGLGTYSATSAGFPAAVTINEIRGGATWPIMYMLSATV